MPKNNSAQRRAERQAAAKHRAETYDMEYGNAQERAAKRGYGKESQTPAARPQRKRSKKP
jgi:hypothetical protein